MERRVFVVNYYKFVCIVNVLYRIVCVEWFIVTPYYWIIQYRCVSKRMVYFVFSFDHFLIIFSHILIIMHYLHSFYTLTFFYKLFSPIVHSFVFLSYFCVFLSSPLIARNFCFCFLPTPLPATTLLPSLNPSVYVIHCLVFCTFPRSPFLLLSYPCSALKMS